jgi:nicotinate dehydrogenase subunit B
MAVQPEMSRRGFLKAGGALVVAFGLVPSLGRAVVLAAGGGSPATVPPEQVDSWIAIARDGVVTIKTGKVELGTGLATATRQLAADELDVSLDMVRLIQGDTRQTVDQTYTAGSQSLKTQWSSGLRQAAATARQKLLEMAASHLHVDVADLTVSDGVVKSVSNPSRSVTYAELLGGKEFAATVSATAPTKRPSQYKLIGKPIPREDIPAKVTGEFTYVQDVRVEGMVHGRVVRPMRWDGHPTSLRAMAATPAGAIINATLDHVDESSIRQLPGDLKVVVKHNFVGVVADREEQAIAGAQSLVVRWREGQKLPDQAAFSDDLRQARVDTTRVLMNDGDVDGALAQAPRRFEATYFHPYQMHASIGPSCAVADVRKDGATVWSGTQGVYQLRTALATLLGLPEDKVHVIYVEGSGCYGLNGADDVSLAAALMSQSVGKPVRVQFMRADEMGWENYGNPMVMHLRAALDDSGTIVAWDHEDWQATRGSRPPPAGNLPTGVLAGAPEPAAPKSPPASPPLGNDASNSIPSYAFANTRVRSYSVYQPWLFTGPLRGPGRIQNTLANESFMDELAAAAGADPVQFRLRHVNDPRLAEAIQRAAGAAGWTSRPSPSPATSGSPAVGRGISALHYEGKDAYLAVVAEVTVDESSGAVRVTRVVVAHDCGTIVNPDGIRNQIEGNVVQSVSRALKEEVRFDRTGVTSLDWTGYPILTFSELPGEVKIDLIDRPGLPAVGAGEPTTCAVASAIGNAIFDATGVRLRQVPFTPDRIKAALASKRS